MRIISGQHKGRRIKAPKNLPVRPTTDRAKESLFNILGNQVDWEQARVLDLFAGTGNISYECASRGSRHVVAVDAHPGCVRFIGETARLLQLPIYPYKRDVMAFLEQSRESFSVIFADPPYDVSEAYLERLVSLCTEGDLMEEGGVLIIEHSPHRDLSGLEGFQETRKYGSTLFTFFRP